jgi:hypothetical protein
MQWLVGIYPDLGPDQLTAEVGESQLPHPHAEQFREMCKWPPALLAASPHTASPNGTIPSPTKLAVHCAVAAARQVTAVLPTLAESSIHPGEDGQQKHGVVTQFVRH